MSDILGGERWRVLTGDCLDLLRGISGVDAVVSDPPFGMNWDTNPQRFTAGRGGQGVQGSRPVLNDDKPFDPSPWLNFPKVILWGSNHYAERLPVGTSLVWVKKQESMYGKFLSDGELGWQKGGHGIYVFRHIWNGVARESENGEHYHPTQKPVALMEWLIGRLNLPPDSIILDPFCGSGTTGVAAMRLGMRFLGCELNEQYADIARARIAAAAAQPRLDFDAPDQAPKPKYTTGAMEL